LAYYRKIYRTVGIIILSAGIVMLPFLRFVIKGELPPDINMYILYILYLVNTSTSYFLFAHKTALLTAIQRLDLTKIVTMIVYVVQYCLQLVALMLFRNYYLYIIWMIVGSALINVANASVARKKFPQYECRGDVTDQTKRDIMTRVKGLLICKISGVTYTSMDSIIISAFIGLSTVAIYNNYITIFNTVCSILTLVRGAMQASIGNSVASESVEKNYKDLCLWQFLFSIIATWCTSCMICLYHPFMQVWMGENMLLPVSVEVIICAWFMISIVQHPYYLYLSGNGLWNEMKWSYIFSTVFNLVMNIILGKFFGVFGIVFASFLSNLISGTFWECCIVFKQYFKRSPKEYFIRQGMYFAVAASVCFVSYMLCGLIGISGWSGLIVKAGICVVVTTVSLILIYARTESFRQAVGFAKRVLRRG
jgi:O-antigen/teichoic acid export membrane protein